MCDASRAICDLLGATTRRVTIGYSDKFRLRTRDTLPVLAEAWVRDKVITSSLSTTSRIWDCPKCQR